MGKDSGPKYLRQGVKVKVLVAQWCPTLCHLMDCILPGSSVHGILQARILEWVTILFSRGSSQPRGQTWVSYFAESSQYEPSGEGSIMRRYPVPDCQFRRHEMQVRSLGQEDPLEEGRATHSLQYFCLKNPQGQRRLVNSGP